MMLSSVNLLPSKFVTWKTVDDDDEIESVISNEKMQTGKSDKMIKGFC